MQKTPIATALTCALLLAASPAVAQDESSATGAPSSQDVADVKTLLAQLQALKGSYAQEVRRLRELDAQVQALQSRLAGKTPAAALPASRSASTSSGNTVASAPAANPNTQAGTVEEARKAQVEGPRRSIQDALLQEHAVFNRRLTLENGLTYTHYERNQLTLNGFLALDSIFLGNISIEKVASDTLTYDFAARYGISPRLTLNLDIPYIGRQTSYQKGGAGGSAAAVAEERSRGTDIGDMTLSANFRLFPETMTRPDTVLTVGVTAPTGRAPYGISWKVLERNADNYIQFAVPEKQPTGNGVWRANVGLSVVKTMDPAIVFANAGFMHSFPRGFADIDTDPKTRSPGDVKLGDIRYFGAGVAFAFNERTSLSLSFSDKLSSKASLRYQGAPWTKVIGSDGNAASYNLGVTYALSPKTTLVTLLGIGLTPDAPDYTLTFKVPYMF
ncbi:MAG: hypothetical protein OQK79_11735 [Rhodanobacter sp.]|jgi:hypothetical protein|nr:hypothetical protein [Rhodanobacter sp.]